VVDVVDELVAAVLPFELLHAASTTTNAPTTAASRRRAAGRDTILRVPLMRPP